MKNKWITPAIILAIILVLYGIYYFEFKKPKGTIIAQDEMVVKKALWDSILAVPLSSKIVYDTIYTISDTIKSVKKDVPKPEVIDSLNFYTDSLVNPEINVYTYDIISGTLLNREWRYVPKTMVFKETKIEYYPQLVTTTVKEEVEVYKTGWYLYGSTGGSNNYFGVGVGIDIITKKDRQMGYQYQLIDGKGFHSIKYGFKIKLRK